MTESLATWVVVADASSAAVLSADPKLHSCDLVEQLSHPESRAKGRDIMADDRGRTAPRNKNATRGSAVAYRTTPHEVEADAFSRELADYLRLARTRNAYRDIVLVASPSFLGRLREALDDPTLARVRASVSKNLTAERPDQALAHIRDELNLPS